MPSPPNTRENDQDRKAVLEWVASAKEGIADESFYLEQNGPSLARFRKV